MTLNNYICSWKHSSNVFREENSNVGCTTLFDIFVASKTNWYDEIPSPSSHSNISDMSSTKNMLREEEVGSCLYIIYIHLVLFGIKLEHSDRAIFCPSVWFRKKFDQLQYLIFYDKPKQAEWRYIVWKRYKLRSIRNEPFFYVQAASFSAYNWDKATR